MTSNQNCDSVRIDMDRFKALVCQIEADQDGTIIPTRQALDRGELEDPNEPPAEKYRLAQAQTLLDAFEQARED